MARHRLRGADRHLARVIAQTRPSSRSSRPGRRAAWRWRARSCSRPGSGFRPASRSAVLHRPLRAPSPFFRRSGDVVSVAAHAEADELCVDARAALLRVFVLFQHDRATAVRQHEAVAIAIPRAARRSSGRRCGWRAPSPDRSHRGRRRSSPFRRRRRRSCPRHRTEWCACRARLRASTWYTP